RVAAAAREEKDAPAFGLYEGQNGSHIETFRLSFPQLELIMPHAQRAFDLLVAHLASQAALPPSPGTPHGGAIGARAPRAGRRPRGRAIARPCWCRDGATPAVDFSRA